MRVCDDRGELLQGALVSGYRDYGELLQGRILQKPVDNFFRQKNLTRMLVKRKRPANPLLTPLPVASSDR
jgi:hypothetical protein